MERSKTKEKYLIEAMRLFADNGYEATGVVEIAEAVGCTTSALYRHFHGKWALYDAILTMAKEEFDKNTARMRIDFEKHPERRQQILTMSEQDLKDLVMNIFINVGESEYPRLFRKLMTVEQFKHPELAEMYNRHYLEGQFRSFENIFRIWIDGGRVKDGDAYMMALQFVSPVVTLIGVYDRAPQDRDRIVESLMRHVHQFCEVYWINSEV